LKGGFRRIESSGRVLLRISGCLPHLGHRCPKSRYELSENGRKGWDYLFAIRDDNIVDVFCISELCQVVLDAILVEDVQEASFGFAEEPRVVLDGISFGRSVDDAEHLLEMFLNELPTPISFRSAPKAIDNYPVEEDLVLFFHARHEHILGQCIGAGAVLLIRSADLLVQGLDAWRQLAMEHELLSFFCCECRAFIVIGRSQE
jgi:hypothetical protein